VEVKKLKYDLESSIEMIGSDDEVFAPAKIMIGYCGENRNWSSISEEVYVNAPIKNIPVVANFISDKNDFGGHDVKIIHTDDGIDFYAATVPFGLVPESAKQWFTEEMVNGEMKKCYWTECLLWKRQYGFEKIAQSKRVNHSMEISASEYTERDDGYVQIDKMRFEALCLLGSDIEPCFENSRLELGYALDAEISEMMEQYKQYCLSHEGVNNMENENKFTENEQVNTPENENVAEPEQTVEPETTANEEFNQAENVAENTESENVSENENTTEGQTESETESVDYELKYNELVSQFDALNEEVETLRKFKADIEAEIRAKEEAEVFAKFEKLNEIEEFTKLKETSSEYSIETLEEKCFAIAGKHGINLFAKETENNETEPVTKFSVVPDNNEKKESIYGNLFELYSNK
jgi:hypothetical protein